MFLDCFQVAEYNNVVILGWVFGAVRIRGIMFCSMVRPPVYSLLAAWVWSGKSRISQIARIIFGVAICPARIFQR